MDIEALLNYAVEHDASDLHLSPDLRPIVRIDGDLQPIEGEAVLTSAVVYDMLKKVMPPQQFDKMKDHFEVDLSIALSDKARFRVNVFKQSEGWSAAFRVIPYKTKTLEELGMPAILKDLCDRTNGLILLTGPTGCGKSTTLAAMIDYINEHKKEHIITLEDPIEFVHKSKQCLIQQREIHQDTASLQDALRAALREDPDVILVGEMRDTETVRLALTAAETGHLVLATLHTNSAAKTINRIIDVFPAGEKALIRSMLSESLQAVVAQALVKKKGGGRVAIHEILICTPAVRNLIREDKIPQIDSVIQTSASLGMITMEKNLEELWDKGIIDPNQ